MLDQRFGGDGVLEKYKYTDSEIRELLNNMVILVDTREKKNSHIIDYFDKHHIEYKKKALSCGDYSFYVKESPELSIPRPVYFDGEIIIERKGNLEELSGNFTNGRARLEEEFAISKANSKYLLIENSDYSDIVEQNYNTTYNKKAFLGTLHSFNHKYNLQIVFMPNIRYTPIYILGVFKYYLKGLVK